jgi:uncharacterized protein (TIGR03435 family)
MRKLVLTWLLAGAVAIVAPAQEKDASFEVASVKANKSGDSNGNLRMLPGGRVNASNMPVRPIITFAYQVAQYQLLGGPGWLTTDRYDLVAKMEGDADPTFVPGASTPNPMQLALRHLLEERFKLKVHRETREMDIYALVLAKPGGTPGPNLKPTTQDCAAAAAAARQGGPPPSGAAPGQPFCGIQGGPGRLRFGGLPVSAFAQAFSGPAGRMVVERTGLTGSWDFELTFAPEGRGGPGGADGAAADPNAPSFFTAVQEQLGLRLEPTKGPVEVVIIDGIEKPVDD